MSLTVGVDLGGSHLRAALLDPSLAEPTFLAEERIDLGPDRRPEQVADLLAAAVRKVQQGAEIAGIGVGIAAMLRGQTGVVANAPNLGWREVDFRTLARARLGEPLDLYNDLNAIAWGEHRFGAGRGAKSILCVYCGTGIGGGIVIEDRLYAGCYHLAGEIGHTKVVLSEAARACGCGQRGCLEAYAGGSLLSARVRAELGAGARSQILALAGGTLEKVHPGHVDEAARAGDPYALTLWREIAPLLGIALANAVTLLNPDRLVMGGSVWEGAPHLRALALETFDRCVNGPTRETVEVVETRLGDRAGVLGAASLISG
jgi:glucokinase